MTAPHATVMPLTKLHLVGWMIAAAKNPSYEGLPVSDAPLQFKMIPEPPCDPIGETAVRRPVDAQRIRLAGATAAVIGAFHSELR